MKISKIILFSISCLVLSTTLTVESAEKRYLYHACLLYTYPQNILKSTMFSDYPLTLHDQIHNLAFSRALSLITCQKHVLVCKIKF